MAHWNRFAAATALAAAVSTAAAPAMARGYYHHHHRWHRDRVDGGDLLAGALIIGGIAAIASAAGKQDRAEPTPPPPPVRDDRQGYAYDGADRDVGLDRAADMCADAVERGQNRVESIDTVSRDRDGWAVSGALDNGAGFGCRIGNDGQVQGVNLGGPRVDGDSQREDDYADRGPQAQGGDDPPPEVDDRPEWHGDDAQPQPQPQDDGRYSTSDAPDFGERT
jgi:hypothetical protein